MLFCGDYRLGADMPTQETAEGVADDVRAAQAALRTRRTVALAKAEFESWRRKWVIRPEPEPEPEPAQETEGEDLDWV